MAIACPVCHSRHADGLAICSTCGHDLTALHFRVCPDCGALSAAAQRRCHRCFALLGEQAAPAGAPSPLLAPFEPEVAASPAPAVETAGTAPDDAGPVTEATASAPRWADLPAIRRDVPLDPLADIGAPLALARAMAQPHRATLSPPSEPGEAERFDAELLGRIAAEPSSLAEGAHRLPGSGGVWLPPALRALFYLLVLAAAILPLLFPGLGADWVQPRPTVRALADTVAALPTGAPVLLVWGYDAGYGGEMDPLARALLRHLAQRQARIDLVALSPASLGQARLTVAGLRADAGAIAVQGYVPVSEAGWRLLANGAAAALGATEPVESVAIADYALVLILGDSAATVRGWIEQVAPYTGVSPYALVTARSEPALWPYLATGQLRGLLGAAWAAPEYEAATGATPEALLHVSGLAGLTLAVMLMAVVAMLAGPGSKSARGKR